MKRLEKQTAKQAATKTTQTGQKKPLQPVKPTPKPLSITTSAKSIKDNKIFGSAAYKRPQPDHGASVSSFRGSAKQPQTSILRSSLQQKDAKRHPVTSHSKPVLVEQKHQSNKKITDLAEILKREQVFEDTMAKVQPGLSRSPLLKALHAGNFEFSCQSFSPLSNKKLDRELGMSPQNRKILDEPQMLLRSGNLASSSEKSVRESLQSKIEISQEYLDIQRIKYSSNNSRASTPTKSKKVIFNDSIIIENSNGDLANSSKSNKLFKPIILHNTQSKAHSPMSFKDQKSPSVSEIRGTFNYYHLNVRDISNALEELKKTENELFPEKHSEPSEKQEEFQTLILNQTSASTGAQSHEFSLANASLSGSSSERNSLGVHSNGSTKQQEIVIPEGEIKALLRNILIEGQVLWEVEWHKKETSFEDEEELRENYNQEFLKLKSEFQANRKTPC